MNSLNTPEKRILSRASRQEIEAYFTSLPRNVRSKYWLRKYNRYRITCTKKFTSDAHFSTIKKNHITSYISASAITHVIDGWAYL